MYLDYGVLPPEVNSGRIYTGPGPGSLLGAAVAWDELAAELSSAAALCDSVTSQLTGSTWTGASSAAMASAVHGYVTWLQATAARAEQTAGQAKAAAGAYSTALAGMVPPAAIAANRSLLTTLIHTNLFGQNTALIGMVEAEYAEMWAQDAAVMYGYSESAAAASTLQPFSNPPQAINPGGQAAQAAAVVQATGAAGGSGAQSTLAQLVGALTSALGSSGSSAPSSLSSVSSSLGTVANFTSLPGQAFGNSMGGWAGIANLISNINNGMGLATFTAQNPEGLFGVLNQPFLGPAALSTGGAGLSAQVGQASAGLGQAIKIGAVSVPQTWAMPAPAITPAAVTLPAGSAAAAVNGVSGAAFGETMLGTLAGRALGAVAARNVTARKHTVVPRSPAAG